MPKPPPHDDDGSMCPLWRSKRAEVCHTCAWYNLVRGKHPQTGEEIDRWDCAVSLMPMLQIDTARNVHRGTESIDALRKEVHANADAAMVSAVGALNQRMDAAQQLAASPQKLLEN